MFQCEPFIRSAKLRRNLFSTVPEDRPLIVQFCGHIPEEFVAAAKLVEHECDAVDVNLGCPQMIARKGHYGAFLLEEPDLIVSIVEALDQNLSIPVTCKIRLLPSLEDTIALAKRIEAAGCSLLAVHGRTKEQKGKHAPHADWQAIRQIKEALSIPVLANGSVDTLEDVKKCLEVSGADGVMCAYGLLKNPSLFAGIQCDPVDMMKEYLSFCERYPTQPKLMKMHLFKLASHLWSSWDDLRQRLVKCGSREEVVEVVDQLAYRYSHPETHTYSLVDPKTVERAAKKEAFAKVEVVVDMESFYS